MEINPLPKLPEDFRSDPKKVFFLGSGVSRINGVVGWEDLAKGLIVEARDKELLEDHYQYEILFQQISANPRKVISIAKNIFQSERKIKSYHAAIKRLLRPNNKLKEKFPIYSILKSFEAVFVTVNIDELFCDYFASSHVHFDVLSSNSFNVNNLYYLHGNIRKPKSVVLTLDEYLTFYRKPEVIDRLKQLLSGEFRVFFIGCGMREMEILEYIVLKSGKGRHYVLLDFFQHETGRLKFENDYYGSESLGISVVPYQKNQFGFNQLYYVVKNWLDEKQVKEKGFLEEVRVLDDAIGKFDSKKVSVVLDVIEKDVYLKDYFFKKVTSLKWFSFLMSLLRHEFNPAPVHTDDKKGLFNIPFWPALTYLEKVSKEAAKPENKKYSEALMGILREVSNPDRDPGKRSDNYRTWYIFSKIMANLPTDVIGLEDIDLIGYWLDSKFDNGLVGHEISRNLLPKLLNGSEIDLKKVVRIIEIATEPKGQKSTLMDFDELDELFQNNAAVLGQKCGKEIISILQKRLESGLLIPQKDETYSYIWRSAVEDHEQNTSRHEPRQALISGLRDVLAAYAQAHDAMSILKNLWRSSSLVVKRIVLLTLNKHFDRYRDMGQELIKGSMPDVFLESNYHHELYDLIVGQFPKFSPEMQGAVIDVFNNLKREWRKDISEHEQAELNMHMRRRWLYAIKQSGYSISNDLEIKYDLDKYKPEHPDFLSYHGPVTWGTEQLFSVGDLMDKGSVKDIVGFLNDFNGKNRFNEVGYEEAGQVLKQAVKANQQFFESDLKEFLNGRFVYQYYALQAFEELWNEKKPIDWQKVIQFLKEIVDSEKLWENETEERTIGFYFRKDWIPSLIARLIQAGVKDNEWPMPDTYLPEARKILEKLLEKIEPSAKGTDSDALTEAINSPKGHAIEAYFNYALRECRILAAKYEKQGVAERRAFWDEIKPIFDKELDKAKNTNFEFSALAGSYLPDLYYLSKEWVETNINKIFPVDPECEKNWRCAISGYSYVNTIYTVIYRLLKDNGHLKRVLVSSFDKSNIRERIIENIAISYLRGEEDLQGENSLMGFILGKWQTQDICSVIDLFWSHREVDFKNGEDRRILALWEYCYGKIKGNEDGNREVLSNLNLLAVFLKTIDSKSKEWLVQSVPYVEERHHSYFFLESLDKLADVNPKEVGEVYVAMIDGNALPLYEEGNIKSIVEKIYKAKEKSLANQICDRYARSGAEFLKDLYEKYNR